MENVFNTKFRNHPEVEINPDLTVRQPGVLKGIFGSSKLDNKTLYETLKKSMSGGAPKLSPEDRNVFTDNLDVLHENGDLTYIQVTVLKIMASKSDQ